MGNKYLTFIFFCEMFKTILFTLLIASTLAAKSSKLEDNDLGDAVFKSVMQCASKGKPCHCPHGKVQICGAKHCTKAVPVKKEIMCDAKTLKVGEHRQHKHCVCTHTMTHTQMSKQARGLGEFKASEPRKLGKTHRCSAAPFQNACCSNGTDNSDPCNICLMNPMNWGGDGPSKCGCPGTC